MACSETEAPRGVGLGFGHVGSGSEVGFTDEKSAKNGISLQLQQFSSCSVSSAGRPCLYFRHWIRLDEAYR